VIKSIRDSETKKILRREQSRKLPPDIQQTAYRKLSYLNNAKDLNDLHAPPSIRLEKLRGDRAGQYSIRINQQWRICFEWKDNDAYEVEIVDYH
jgi:proteic killer suppression protein